MSHHDEDCILDGTDHLGPCAYSVTQEHHPLCDDNGWDHPGECVPETEILHSIIGDDIKGWCHNAIEDWNAADRESVDQLTDAGGLLVDIIRTVILGELL